MTYNIVAGRGEMSRYRDFYYPVDSTAYSPFYAYLPYGVYRTYTPYVYAAPSFRITPLAVIVAVAAAFIVWRLMQ